MEKIADKTDIICENEKLIANILHDIKSPLYSIKIGLQRHLEDELMCDVYTTAVNILEYIEKFLVDYSFRRGKFENKITSCDIKNIINKKIENYKYIFLNKNIKIDFEQGDEKYTVSNVEIFISSIIGNIVSNIAFHGCENKNALIKLCKKNNSIIIDFKNYCTQDSCGSSLGLDFCQKLCAVTKTELRYSKNQNCACVNLKIPNFKTGFKF